VCVFVLLFRLFECGILEKKMTAWEANGNVHQRASTCIKGGTEDLDLRFYDFLHLLHVPDHVPLHDMWVCGNSHVFVLVCVNLHVCL